MSFDVDKLFDFCRMSIARFAREHSSETFYAFAIDADMLCLNSVEQFAETLHEYQASWDRQTRNIDRLSDMTHEDMNDEKLSLDMAVKFNGLDRSDEQAVLRVINENRARRRERGCTYRTDEGIRDLRNNTGDWAYQGFAEMHERHGFDSELYSDHYDEAGESEDGRSPDSEYATAMSELIERLQRSDVFDPLNRSDDFTVSWVDHDY